jgi:hypothetical protein
MWETNRTSLLTEQDLDFIIREFFQEVKYKHESIKVRAERTINENMERYRAIIEDTTSYHLIMKKRMMQDGHYDSAEYHKMMAQIYDSIIENI